jgi:serine phosphatase RsbU (regulator of sigma subunit)
VQGPRGDYGEDCVIASVTAHRQSPTAGLLEAVVSDAESYADADGFEDDVCLLGIDVGTTD